MTETIFAALDWKSYLLSGPDRKTFLHGLLTNDVNGLRPGAELPCCLLTPKGMLQALLWVYDEPQGLRLVCPPECAGNLEAALRKMTPLSESALEDVTARAPLFWLGADGPAPFSAYGRPGSLAALRPAGRELSAAELERRRVESALPRWGVDVDERTIPLEAGLERAISYTKGCYMGQETISRIHHMGRVNRRLVRLKFEGAAPAAPAAVTSAGAEVGRLTSAAGDFGLAMVRAEQAAAGTRLDVGGRAAVVG